METTWTTPEEWSAMADYQKMRLSQIMQGFAETQAKIQEVKERKMKPLIPSKGYPELQHNYLFV